MAGVSISDSARVQTGSFFESLADGSSLGHAYLLVGPANSSREDAVQLIAQTAVCSSGRCSQCEDCRRVFDRSHPDVHVISPQSAQGYLVGQIRDLIDDIQLSPIRASRKVYVLNDAQKLTASSANALLKSLEEPPADTVFVLLASSAEAVLPTIVSRCQTIPFPSFSPSEALDQLVRLSGADDRLCRRALGFCADVEAARKYLSSEARQRARTKALDAVASLPHSDELCVITAASEIMQSVKGYLEDLEASQADEAERVGEMLGAAGMKELAERHKREVSSAERSGIIELLCAQRAFFRDCLTLSMDSGGILACDDYAASIADCAHRLQIEGSVHAIQIVSNAIRRVETNVTPRMAVEAMLLELKEIIQCEP